MSVIEHASFTFGVKEVSRSLTHQLVRHRIAYYTQQSQRYVELNNPDYVIPNSIRETKTPLKNYQKHMEATWKLYNSLIDKGIPQRMLDSFYLMLQQLQSPLQ